MKISFLQIFREERPCNKIYKADREGQFHNSLEKEARRTKHSGIEKSENVINVAEITDHKNDH